MCQNLLSLPLGLAGFPASPTSLPFLPPDNPALGHRPRVVHPAGVSPSSASGASDSPSPGLVVRGVPRGTPHCSRVLLCAADPRTGGAASRRRRIGAAPRALPRAAPGSGRKEAARGGGRRRTQSLIPRPRRRLRHCCTRERATRSLGARLEPILAGAGRGVSAGGEPGGRPSIFHAEDRGRRAGG